MTNSPSRRASSPTLSQWILDPSGCRLLLAFPDSRFRGLSAAAASGFVELREDGLVGSRISFHLPAAGPSENGGPRMPGLGFDGSAIARGAQGEMVVEGRLRIGDRVDTLTLAVIPTLYHRRGDTEYLDLDVCGALPSGGCDASRVEGRLRILRPDRAA